MSTKVFVSSSILRGFGVNEALDTFASSKASGIEWSGGHPFSESQELEIPRILRKATIPSRLHNYFPPPKEDFVLNLASPNSEVARKSMEHVKKAINLSSEIGAPIYGIHAGFFFDPESSTLGQRFSKLNVFPRAESIHRFCERFIQLQDYAKQKSVKLYVENNVLSKDNLQSFGYIKPMMLLDIEDWRELQDHGIRNLLLDVSHLYVSAHSLELGYTQQVRGLFEASDYIHVSINDGTSDTNEPIFKCDGPLKPLRGASWKNKEVTVEVYSSLNEAIHSAEFIQQEILTE